MNTKKEQKIHINNEPHSLIIIVNFIDSELINCFKLILAHVY